MALVATTSQQQNFQALVLSCNKDGMDALRKGQHKAAFEQFKYAEAVLIANQAEGDATSLSAVTCNNLGCYYKKVGKLHGALSYLRRALNMEIDLQTDEVTLAGTHLNICAILSKLEKHDKAVQHALSALELISSKVSGDADGLTQDHYSVLAIAYHNVAVERDFLHQYDKAAASFQQGFQVAKHFLGDEHPLTLALQKNCAAVLEKSTKVGKGAAAISHKQWSPPTFGKDSGLAAMEATGLPQGLPSITGAQPASEATPAAEVDGEQDASMPSAMRALREEAAAWAADPVPEGEAASTIAPPRKPPPVQASPRGQQATLALRESQLKDLVYPSFKDTALSRDLAYPVPTSSTLSPPGRKTLPLRETLEDPPEAIMDIIDADSTGQKLGPSRFSPNDFRPNRVVKGSTRTARVVRRTGLYQSTKHRDQIISQRHTASQPKQVYLERVAAEKIQRFWRAWHKYCLENRDWIDVSTESATKIQAHWRSFRVRKGKVDKAATTVQRHARGRQVRQRLRRIRAAITIQRHALGMLTRMKLAKMARAAVKMQALIRGFLGRRRALARRRFLTKTAICIQSGVRMMIGKRIVRERRTAWRFAQGKLQLALNCQRFYRGWKGRERYAAAKAAYEEDVAKYHAATKLQALARRDQAQKKVDDMRAQRLQKMAKAATFIGKMWRGYIARKKYKQLIQAFSRHEKYVITMQRFARGFLVRVRMWREAVRTEEQLWGALEIQRVWRGYLGRVRWENALEKVWRAETSAAMIQRTLRGWLARCKVGRIRRKIARSEFEQARQRFRSARKIQALARGVQVRGRFLRRLEKCRAAALVIQRIHRGHILRKQLWGETREIRALLIQARVRGFLVRNRRFHLIAKVIHIQRAYRKWLRKPQAERQARFEHMQLRKQSAARIQQQYRASADKQAKSASPTPPAAVDETTAEKQDAGEASPPAEDATAAAAAEGSSPAESPAVSPESPDAQLTVAEEMVAGEAPPAESAPAAAEEAAEVPQPPAAEAVQNTPDAAPSTTSEAAGEAQPPPAAEAAEEAQPLPAAEAGGEAQPPPAAEAGGEAASEEEAAGAGPSATEAVGEAAAPPVDVEGEKPPTAAAEADGTEAAAESPPPAAEKSD
mmetsp:Transcript_15288/g.35819  ORF Transcript_15288/g.35819 Transcript_15288/m.35819 type:complete len:1121 (+) Transcript_15288:150-3512(+)